MNEIEILKKIITAMITLISLLTVQLEQAKSPIALGGIKETIVETSPLPIESELESDAEVTFTCTPKVRISNCLASSSYGSGLLDKGDVTRIRISKITNDLKYEHTTKMIPPSSVTTTLKTFFGFSQFVCSPVSDAVCQDSIGKSEIVPKCKIDVIEEC